MNIDFVTLKKFNFFKFFHKIERNRIRPGFMD